MEDHLYSSKAAEVSWLLHVSAQSTVAKTIDSEIDWVANNAK